MRILSDCEALAFSFSIVESEHQAWMVEYLRQDIQREPRSCTADLDSSTAKHAEFDAEHPGRVQKCVRREQHPGTASQARRAFLGARWLSEGGVDGHGPSAAGALPLVYPQGATLTVQRPAVPILSTGKIAYPMHRPIGEAPIPVSSKLSRTWSIRR
jgi:hypothetical protein